MNWLSRPVTALCSVSDEIKANQSYLTEIERKELWKKISSLERQAVELLLDIDSTDAKCDKEDEVFKLLAESSELKSKDPFLSLCTIYSRAKAEKDTAKMQEIIEQMKVAKLPPHLSGMVENLSGRSSVAASTAIAASANSGDSVSPISSVEIEEVDPGSTFSDTVTDKIRVKVSSFYDRDKSDPPNGKFMFWYKVAIYNEGPEPVQIVARMWEIEKCRGEKEVVRGAGIMSTQPIIPPGDVFTYQSVCPLKVFPPKGKRLLGSMSGAYTMCKGNMGQHNFTVKVSKFNLILPDSENTESLSK